MIKEEILRSYKYDCSTGGFLWSSTKMHIKRTPGHFASNGYLRLRFRDRYFPAHHLVWAIETGSLPSSQIDHIDGDRLNNRFSNLREVSPIENSQNQRYAHKTSKSGLLGASPSGKAWRAQIKVNKKSIHLGSFNTPDEAHSAYINAKRMLHKGCTI